MTSIGNEAFWNCRSLSSISIPNSVTKLGGQVFYGCENLTAVHISDLESWCTFSFEDSYSNPLSYAHHLFLNGEEIKNLKIPDSVTSIGAGAFTNCSGLISITFGNSLTYIGPSAFSGCSGLTSITIDKNVTTIGSSAFDWCDNLKSVIFGNNVKTIEVFAFFNCAALANITIGSGIETIGSQAFSECKEITNVFCYGENVPSTNSNAFEGSYIEYATLHVPEASISIYQTTEPWMNFKSIVIALPLHTLLYWVDNKLYKSYQIEEGATITKETAPTKEGYTFSGWSEIPETMPDHDVTVTGTFSVNKYKLTYKVDGVEYKTSEVEYGTAITTEDEPTKEGYTFSGWSEIPETMPAHDVTVTGTFTVNKYTITYKIDGEVFKTESVEYDSPIITPEAPEKEGYTFEWMDVPETMPAKDITIEGSYTSGINAINADDEDVKWYTLEGKCLETPQKGINIIKNSKGTTKKVLAK